MEKIVLKNLIVGGECNLFHYGKVYDYLLSKDFEFCQGNVYGIIGEFGMGGAALSCGLTGNTDYHEGKIFCDGKEVSIEELAKKSWYIGNDLYTNNKKSKRHKSKINKHTIKEQIACGIKINPQELTVKEIQKLFEISDARFERNINYVSGERWKASAAIGYANGKDIYCYPWMNSKDIEHLKEQLTNTIKVLQEKSATIIIPTTKEDNIRKICSEYEIILI